jgi:hypothetical protein
MQGAVKNVSLLLKFSTISSTAFPLKPFSAKETVELGNHGIEISKMAARKRVLSFTTYLPPLLLNESSIIPSLAMFDPSVQFELGCSVRRLTYQLGKERIRKLMLRECSL